MKVGDRVKLTIVSQSIAAVFADATGLVKKLPEPGSPLVIVIFDLKDGSRQELSVAETQVRVLS